MLRLLSFVAPIVAVLLWPAFAAAAEPRYEITARVDRELRTIEGEVRIEFANQATASLDSVLLHLAPNRFRADGEEVNDMTRRYVYPSGTFDAGGIEIEDVAVSGQAGSAVFRTTTSQGLPADSLLAIDLPARVAPAQAIELRIRFRTLVPVRYGPFGATELGLAAIGGWYPYLVTRDRDGTWHPDWSPAPATISATVSIEPELAVVLGSQIFRPGHAASVSSEERSVRNFPLVALENPQFAEVTSNGTTIRFAAPITPRSRRDAPGPGPEERLHATVAKAIELRPPTVAAPASLTVVEVPLRWNLTTPSDGTIVVSDRSMDLHPVLESFHAAQLAQAVYAELLRPRVLQCEPPESQQWVLQGLAWELAERFVRKTEPDHWSMHDWIRRLDVIALIDRFESAPKVPFVQAFFENSVSDDELRESVFTYASDQAPGRMVLARLDRRYGAATVQAAVDGLLARTSGPCETFLQALDEASELPPGAVREAVTDAEQRPDPPGPFARVDPSLRPLPARSEYQFVLDSADVEVSSSEFGVAALFLARKRYDYTKDFAINPFVSERSYGTRVGPRFHWGERVDPNTYRHNLFGYYTISGLDSSFKDDSRPEVRNSGGVGGFGLAYDYSNVYWFDNPTEKRELRLFVDAHDPSFGGSYGFLRYGARVRATTQLFTPNTIGALELLGGFEENTTSAGAPIQEQYALGGQKAIRGIPVDERLARNIGLVRAEVRQEIYPEFDLNLLDLVTYRRPQLRLFVDSGNVDDSAGRALDPSNYAVGGGVGLGILYDVLGFFPGVAYFEVATRLDRDQQDVQVLFGARQAF